MIHENGKIVDIAIIGAGPGGMAAAIEAKQRAEEDMANRKGDMDLAKASAELAEAAALVETIKKIKGRR